MSRSCCDFKQDMAHGCITGFTDSTAVDLANSEWVRYDPGGVKDPKINLKCKKVNSMAILVNFKFKQTKRLYF